MQSTLASLLHPSDRILHETSEVWLTVDSLLLQAMTDYPRLLEALMQIIIDAYRSDNETLALEYTLVESAKVLRFAEPAIAQRLSEIYNQIHQAAA